MVLKNIGKLLEAQSFIQIKSVKGDILYFGQVSNCDTSLADCEVVHLKQLVMVSTEYPSVNDITSVLQIVIME